MMSFKILCHVSAKNSENFEKHPLNSEGNDGNRVAEAQNDKQPVDVERAFLVELDIVDIEVV